MHAQGRADSRSHGSQGVLDGASKASLDNEFGTAKEEDCMVKILEGGEYQSYTVSLHMIWIWLGGQPWY